MKISLVSAAILIASQVYVVSAQADECDKWYAILKIDIAAYNVAATAVDNSTPNAAQLMCSASEKFISDMDKLDVYEKKDSKCIPSSYQDQLDENYARAQIA